MYKALLQKFNYQNPLHIGVVVALFGLVIMLLSSIGVAAGFIAPIFYWISSGACLLMYAVASAAIMLSVKADFFMYSQRSIMTFMALLIVLGLMASAFSGVSIFEAETFRSVYIILIIAAFILQSIGLFIKRVVIWLDEEEESVRRK